MHILLWLSLRLMGGRVPLPLAPIPRPPPPAGRGRRPWARYARTLELWSTCERARTAINRLWDSKWEEELGPPLEARIRAVSVDRLTRDMWNHIIAECKRILVARRAARLKWPTGAAVFSRITKVEGDFTYSGGLRPYRRLSARAARRCPHCGTRVA